MLLMVLYNKER